MPQHSNTNRGDIDVPPDTDDVAADAVRWIPSPNPIDALLGAQVPANWADPARQRIRTGPLAQAATLAGEAMAELLVRLPAERALGKDPLAEGGAAMACVDANFNLHKALNAYRRETLRYDGEAVARETITRSHGAGIADRTLQALHDLRELIPRETLHT
jgi:hypothetical protein